MKSSETAFEITISWKVLYQLQDSKCQVAKCVLVFYKIQSKVAIIFKHIDPDEVACPGGAVGSVAVRALPGYGNRRVWVRGPGWPHHCVRL